MPGMYAEASLTLSSPHRVFELPATALMTDSRGPRIAVVDDEARIHFLPVAIERDTGATIEVSTGPKGGERVARLGSAEFEEGRQVEVAR